MENHIEFVEQVNERGRLYTRFRGYGQDLLVCKTKRGRMTLNSKPLNSTFGIDIIGVNIINTPKHRDNPRFYYKVRLPFNDDQWPEIRQNYEDAMAFTEELVRRKNELFGMAGFDMSTYREEDYSEIARKYVEEHPEATI